jgi:hypothetical protein
MAFTDLVHHADLRICRSGSLLVTVLGPGPLKAGSLELIRLHHQTAVSERGRISVLTVMPVGQAAPSEDVRHSASELDRWHDEVAVAVATVVPKGSLGATLVRSARTALSLVGRGSAPRRTFAELALALAWLKSRPEQVPEVQRITVAQLVDHLGDGRARAA